MDNIERANKNLLDSAAFGDEPGRELVLADGADLESRDANGWIASMLAARQGGGVWGCLLIPAKADIDAKDEDGSMSAGLACSKGRSGLDSLIEGTIPSRKEALELGLGAGGPPPSQPSGRAMRV